MDIFSQIKKGIKKAEFSKDAKEKIDSILSSAQKKGGFSEAEKEELLSVIQTDAMQDLAEAEGCRIVLQETNKILE